MRSNETTVKIANLSFKDTEDGIISIFKKYGTVVKATINKDAQTCYIYYENIPDLSIYHDEIISNNKILRTIPFEMKKCVTSNKGSESVTNTRIFFSNINKNLKILDVRKIVKPFGKIVDIRVQNTGKKFRNKGFCFVEFKNEMDAIKFTDSFSSVKIYFGDKTTIEYAKKSSRLLPKKH